MDSHVKQAMYNSLIYLSQYNPTYIEKKFMKHFNECYQYIKRKHPVDTYLGNDNRAKLTLYSEALADCFSKMSLEETKEFAVEVCHHSMEVLFQIEDMSFMLQDDIYDLLDGMQDNLAAESMFTLFTYHNDSENIDILKMHGSPVQDVSFNLLKEHVENLFHMEQSFEECPFVKKGVKKLRKYLRDDMICNTNKEMFENVSLGELIINSLEMVNGYTHSVPSINAQPSMNYFKDHFESVFVSLGYNNWIINALTNYKQGEQLVTVAERAIDEFCRAAIIAQITQDVMSVDRLEVLTNTDLEELYLQTTQEKFQPCMINQFVVKINTKFLAISCLWYVIMTLIREQMYTYQLDSIYLSRHRYDIENEETAKELKKAKEQISQLERTNNSLNDTIKMQKKRIEEYNKEKPVVEKKDTRSIELSRTVRKQESEIERLRKLLEEEQKKFLTLEQKYDNLKTRVDNDVCKCDYDKKYVFICEHQITARRLMDKFPNSISSSSYDINPTNVSTIDAVVCITPEISHGEYERVKNQCITYKVPFINCNSINIDRVAKTIATELI